MIRVEFDTVRFASWAHEMTAHRQMLETMRKHGIPVIGRLVYTGIERGRLVTVQDREKLSFDFAEDGEALVGVNPKQTHSEPGVKVFMSGEHLQKHEATDDLW